MCKTLFKLFWIFYSLLMATQAVAEVENDIAGAWSLYSFDLPDGGSKSLTGIWWNQEDGQFVHQVMHSGDPLQSQIAECHYGRYRVLSPGKMKVDVEKGSVANSPRSQTLLSTRNNMSFEMGYELSGDKLKIGHEHLVKISTERMDIFSLSNGKLAFSDEHLLLVTVSDNGPLCGAGRYYQDGENLHLVDWSWFKIVEDEVVYTRNGKMEAVFDGKELRFSSKERFKVIQ